MSRAIKLGALLIVGLGLGPITRADSGSNATSAFSWNWPAYIVVPLLVSLVLYATGFLRLRLRSREGCSGAVWFCAGWISLLVALDSPIHELSERFFWVHMTQHEILMLVSAPMLIIARPLVTILWALPKSWRLRAAALGRARFFRLSWLAISAPVAAWLLHALALWLWHAPLLFNAALKSESVHAAQHISFFSTALVFWWTLIYGQRGRLGYGGSALYVFSTAVHMSLLSALLTFSPTPWYGAYAQTATESKLSALQDQQLGGLIMWVPAGAIMLVITLVLFGKWLKQSDTRWDYTRTAALVRSPNPIVPEGSK